MLLKVVTTFGPSTLHMQNYRPRYLHTPICVEDLLMHDDCMVQGPKSIDLGSDPEDYFTNM